MNPSDDETLLNSAPIHTDILSVGALEALLTERGGLMSDREAGGCWMEKR